MLSIQTKTNKEQMDFSWLPKFVGFDCCKIYFKIPIVFVYALIYKFIISENRRLPFIRFYNILYYRFLQNTLDGMASNAGSNISPNLLESASKPDWNRLSLENLQELKNRIFQQGFGVDSLTSKNPFLPGLPYLHRAAQFPIVPPTVPFDTAAAFSYLAQMTATANAIHSMPDSNAVAAAMASQIKREKSITPPINHRHTASATPSPSQQSYDNSDAPLNLSKPKQSYANHLGRSVSYFETNLFFAGFLFEFFHFSVNKGEQIRPSSGKCK